MATGSVDHTIQIWGGRNAKRFGGRLDHAAEVNTVAFNPMNDRLATAAGSNVHIWRQPTGDANYVFSLSGKKLVRTLGASTSIVDFDSGETLQSLARVTCFQHSAAFSDNERMVATGGEDQRILLWDPSTGHAIGLPMTVTERIDHVQFTNNDTLLLVATTNGMIWFFDVATQQLTRTQCKLPIPFRQRQRSFVEQKTAEQ